MRDFERNGLNLTLTKRDEMQCLKAQIDGLSLQYIQNLNDDNTFLLFNEAELAGLPHEFLKVQYSLLTNFFYLFLLIYWVPSIQSLFLVNNISIYCYQVYLVVY